ncbi:MAG: hypothetical protein GY948_17000 [Alphaproteobacteria bacterium]|nr:hypothetical protein [Alphaproteobacteria bacterium]
MGRFFIQISLSQPFHLTDYLQFVIHCNMPISIEIGQNRGALPVLGKRRYLPSSHASNRTKFRFRKKENCMSGFASAAVETSFH